MPKVGRALHGYCEHKARKGLIRVSIALEKDMIKNIRISGDFFLYPEESLWDIENELTGTRVTEIDYKLKHLFSKHDIVLAGATVEDFIKTIKCAIENARGPES